MTGVVDDFKIRAELVRTLFVTLDADSPQQAVEALLNARAYFHRLARRAGVKITLASEEEELSKLSFVDLDEFDLDALLLAVFAAFAEVCLCGTDDGRLDYSRFTGAAGILRLVAETIERRYSEPKQNGRAGHA